MTMIDTKHLHDPSSAPDVNPSGGVARRVGSNKLDKDGFMQIFLAQMLKQDPMKPFDSSEILQNMGQLTSLSASEELKGTIKTLGTSIAKSQVMMASQLVGKKVQIGAKAAPMIPGTGVSGSVIVTDKDARDITITIKDKTGQTVKTLNKGNSGTGILDFNWDAKQEDGTDYPPGLYDITATAVVNGKTVTYQTAGTFKVDSVSMNQANGVVYVNIDGVGGVETDRIIKILN